MMTKEKKEGRKKEKGIKEQIKEIKGLIDIFNDLYIVKNTDNKHFRLYSKENCITDIIIDKLRIRGYVLVGVTIDLTGKFFVLFEFKGE